MARPQPRTVWMVRPGRAEAAEGRLTLTTEALVFDHQAGEGLVVSLDRIRGVRRRPGTPVLVVRFSDEGGRPTSAFFFFSRPPPISSREDLRARRRPFLPSPRGLERTASIMTLRAAARQARQDIAVWVRAIRAGAT